MKFLFINFNFFLHNILCFSNSFLMPFFEYIFLLFRFSSIYFSFLSQLPVVMSKKNMAGLSNEELEIQRVLDSPSSRSTVSAPTSVKPSSVSRGEPSSAPLTVHDMKSIFAQFSQDLTKTVMSLAGHSKEHAGPPRESSDEDIDEDGDESDSEMHSRELIYPAEGDVAAPPLFGVDVNEVLHPGVDVDVHVPAPMVAPHDVPVVASGSRPPALGAQVQQASVAEPDADLPCGVNDRPPVNWHPHPAVISWANLVIDKVEWTDVERKALAMEFSPDPVLDHLFTAVPPPPGLLKAIKDPLTWDRDYLFRRAETERLLHEAQKDLASSLRPLLEVLSSTKDVDGLGPLRVQLSKVFSGMASSASYISRGRRELGRRFVPLETAPRLFSNKPTHYCYFGHKSIDEAVKDAVETKQVNKDLVRLPQKFQAQRPFRKTANKPSWKGFQNNFRDQSNSKFQPGQKWQKSGRKRGARGRGRGRGAKKSKEQ